MFKKFLGRCTTGPHCLGILAAGTVLLAPLMTSPHSDAAPVLYEGFDYGGTAGSLVGKGSAGGGWGGAWAVGTFTYSGSPSYVTDYEAGGLTFSDLAVMGGNASIYSNWNGGVNAGREHSVAVTGDAWGSFLFQRTTSPASTALFSLNATGSLTLPDNYGQFSVAPDKYASSLGSARIGGFAGSEVTNSGSSISTGETYLALFKITNLGGAGTHTITDWLLTEDQFDFFKAGGITEAELNAATLGAGATQVFQRGTASSTESADLPAGGYLNLQNYYFDNGARYDEIRISTTSLAEVVPLAAAVPEPSSLAGLLSLMGAGVVLFAGRRQRRPRARWC